MTGCLGWLLGLLALTLLAAGAGNAHNGGSSLLAGLVLLYVAYKLVKSKPKYKPGTIEITYTDDGENVPESPSKTRKTKAPVRRGEVKAWALSVISNPDLFAIIDTETTGFSNESEIVEISAIDPTGKELLNTRIKPLYLKRMPSAAKAVHGIGMPDLKSAPSWPEAIAGIRSALAGRTLIAYNCEFDERMVRQTARSNGGGGIDRPWHCAMIRYAEHVGDWDEKRGRYRWHKLEGGDHSSLGDCLATLELIRRMAA